MELRVKMIYLVISTFIFSGILSAQKTERSAASKAHAGHFYGKVIDSKNYRPIEAASIQLTQIKVDSVTKKNFHVLVAVMLTNKKGEFSIDKLQNNGNFNIIITATGFESFSNNISFNQKIEDDDMGSVTSVADKDLGNIKMLPEAKLLKEVQVAKEKNLLQMNIDRKIFNVGKSLTSIGGTAIDILKKVPLVNVDMDGNVSLRNAAPQIFVDGRPTTLMLEQIPADEIESVEIITNPSAKFDASGGSGILNIILKKNIKPGYNGNLRANLDSRLSYGAGADFNIKQGKTNFFVNSMFVRRKSIGNQSTYRTDYINGTKAILSQQGSPGYQGYFGYGRVGMDYFPDNRNTFSLSGMMVGGKFTSFNTVNITRDSIISIYNSHEKGLNSSNGYFNFGNFGGTLSYKHNFAKPDKNITADANYNYSNTSNGLEVATQYYYPDNTPKGPNRKQMSYGIGITKYLTVQTDYTNPINDKMKLEAGLRGALRNYNSDNQNFLFDDNLNKYVSAPYFNSKYDYEEQVYAGYLIFTHTIKGFTYQIGNRIESSKYAGKLVDSNMVFGNSYPFSFFPSVYLTQKINDKQDIQANYSRKISRPNFFQLLPYYDYSDSLNINRGNPSLLPEFTNLFELSYQLNLKKGNNMVVTGYYRITDNLITNYQYRDKNPTPGRNDSIFISTFANAASSYAYGLEITSTNNISHWWNITTDLNLYNSKINGENLQSGLSKQQLSWFGKLNNTFKLPENITIQLAGDYTSRSILPQGRAGGEGGRMFGSENLSTANGYTDPEFGFDFAIRKDFLKDKSASVSIGINDFLRTRTYKVHFLSQFSNSVYSNQENIRIRDPQLIRLNLNWRFGKFDISLFKRKNIKAEQEGLQNGMQVIQ